MCILQDESKAVGRSVNRTVREEKSLCPEIVVVGMAALWYTNGYRCVKRSLSREIK